MISSSLAFIRTGERCFSWSSIILNHTHHREKLIEQKLHEIRESNSPEILERVGLVYRANYKSRCKGMSWHLPLPLLQLAAVSLGPKTLAGLCQALALNFKFFSSGAPDLFMMRLTLEMRLTRSRETVSLSEVLGEGWRGEKLGQEEDLSLPKRAKTMSSPSPGKELDLSQESPTKESPFVCPFADLALPSTLKGESMLVEVKGPSDRLSLQQTTWLQMLAGLGAKAFVCRVREGR